MFKFGVAERDITPEAGAGIPGYFIKRVVGGVIDNLYAKAMVLDDGETVFVSVVCDTINLERDDVLRIRRGINEACGTEEKNIAVSATHSHTAGPSFAWYTDTRDEGYMTKLINASIDAAKAAFESRKPAKIGFTKTELPGYTWIRRLKLKDGKYDTNVMDTERVDSPVGTPDFSLLIGKVCDAEGKLLAFISNYGVHLDMTGGSLISADFPGYLSRFVKEKYGEDVVSFFLTGPCGNTAHVNYMEKGYFEKFTEAPKRTGKAIFDKISEFESRIELSDDVKISTGREFLSAKLRKPTEEQVASAMRYLGGSDLSLSAFPKYMKNRPFTKELIAKATLDAAKSTEHHIDVEIAVMSLPDTAFVFFPGEVFVEFGKTVREAFPEKNIVISELSNGCVQCYITTEEAVAQGGYEPTITGPRMVEPKLGYDMADAAVSILKKEQ